MSDEEIAIGIREGSRDAFSALYARYSDQLFALLIRMLGRREIAEEVLQELFVQIIKKINFYKGKNDIHGGFKPWVFRVASNLAIDRIRMEKRKRRVANVEISKKIVEGPAVEMERSEERDDLNRVIEKLPLLQKTVLTLRVKEEMSYVEISRVCGVSIESVKQGLFKARVNLKRMLDMERGEVI